MKKLIIIFSILSIIFGAIFGCKKNTPTQTQPTNTPEPGNTSTITPTATITNTAIPGTNWTRIPGSYFYSGRYKHNSAVFSNKLWIFAGRTSAGLQTNAYSSLDGQTWNLETFDTGFGTRELSSTTVFDGKLWIIGGLPGPKNDIWHSSNGIDWTQATSNAAFNIRAGHTAMSFANKLWVIGGNQNSYICECLGGAGYTDAWYSINGVDWTLATTNAAVEICSGSRLYHARFYHSSVVFQNKMWVIGGITVGNSVCGGSELCCSAHYMSDVWFSTDGVNWTRATANAGFNPRAYHTSVVYDNNIYVIGGRNNTTIFNDIWRSADGLNWTRLTDNVYTEIPYTFLRYQHTSEVFNNKIWTFGGANHSNIYDDVWFTP